VISPARRYQHIVEELQQLARSLLIFRMHIHVAMPDKQTTIDMMNMVRYFLPHLLALSTSSPSGWGRNTGLKSFRTTVFPEISGGRGFRSQFESWSEYENFVKLAGEHKLHEPGKRFGGTCDRIRHLDAGIPDVRRDDKVEEAWRLRR